MPEKTCYLQVNASKVKDYDPKIAMKPFMNLLRAFLYFGEIHLFGIYRIESLQMNVGVLKKSQLWG